jgi:acyl carrier protein
MDELELFNRLARHVRPAFTDYTPIETMEIPFSETGLDSMDGLMMLIHLEDIYGIDDEIAKHFTFTTPAELMAQVHQHKTKEPESVDAAMEGAQ